MSVAANMALAGLSAGLVAYYPFNGNANDESGNGSNGTATGGASGLMTSSEIKTVDGKSNIFAAGLTSVPAFKGGGGLLPIETDLTGDVSSVSFSATGLVNCCGNTPNSPPDGVSDLPPTNVNNYNGISGIKAPNAMMLLGVFLGSGLPSGTAPPILDFNTIGINFTTLSPKLQQTFFIGDGVTSSGTSQTFTVPIGATRLFLGIADAYDFSDDPSYYGDNTGSFKVTITLHTPTKPTATTNVATNVKSNSATLNGKVNANGGTTTAWFEYGMTSGTYSNTTSLNTASGWSDTDISADASGLSSGTAYYYRAVAQNSEGAAYGSETSFTTLAPPEVVTGNATSITMISATLNGTVNAKGTSTTAWFEYGTVSGAYGNTTTQRSVSGSSDTSVSVYISGLSSGTTYYYRLLAENNAGTAYGSEKSFATTSVTSPTPSPTTGTTPTPAVSPTPTPSTGYPGFISGSVTDANTGKAISGATVSTNTGGYSATTGSSGSYVMQVAANTYTLTASASGYQSASQPVTVSALSTTTASFSLTPVATPTPTPTQGTGVLFGFVYDEDDNPMKGVTVAITGSGYSGSEETDDDGYYEFRDLSAGDYTITYKKEGYQTQTAEVTLEEGDKKEAETVAMILTESGKIYGYVMNIKGDPIESVRLKLKGIGTKAVKRTSTDADGFFEFADLDADTYVIFASKKGYKKTKSTIKLEEGEDKEVEIEMKKTTKRGLLMTEEIR